jgi:hypothetical protein
MIIKQQITVDFDLALKTKNWVQYLTALEIGVLLQNAAL